MAKNKEIFRTKSGRLEEFNTGTNTITIGAEGSVIVALTVIARFSFNLTSSTTANVTTFGALSLNINGINLVNPSILEASIKEQYPTIDITFLNDNNEIVGLNSETIKYNLKDLLLVDYINIEPGDSFELITNGVSGFVMIEDY